MSDLSLFDIEAGLHDLLGAWQTAETPEAVAAAEQAIQAHVAAEIRKVDGIRRYYRACDAQEKAAKEEAAVQTARAKMWGSRRDRLKAFVFDVMQSFGVKKLEGETGSLQIKGNGGLQPLTITDSSLIPDELCVWQGEIDGGVIQALTILAPAQVKLFRMVRTPNTAAIRAALAETCPRCHGLPTCRDSQTFGNLMQVDTICPDCGGSGKRSVAGARLEDRGSHLEIK